ncbi:MAG: dockerin type I domain-containing protein [Ruminococcus sp.]|nr:dockerin type I domain-containing protein [Ruminococcus sp.]
MNRPMRKLLAFSASAAMLANVPLMGANAKYVAEQVGGKDFDTMIQYPDRNLYIENGSAGSFAADQQLVVVCTDGTTKLISLSEGIDGGISYASTTMGIYDFLMPSPAEYGFDFYDPAYRISTKSGAVVVDVEGNKCALMDKDGKFISDRYDRISRISEDYYEVVSGGNAGVIDSAGKVIIPPAEGVLCVYLTYDGKNFFVDGDGRDYLTDLSGKTASAVYDNAGGVKSLGGWSDGTWTFDSRASETTSFKLAASGYCFEKDGKYALGVGDFEPKTDYYDRFNPTYSNDSSSSFDESYIVYEAQEAEGSGDWAFYSEVASFDYKGDLIVKSAASEPEFSPLTLYFEDEGGKEYSDWSGNKYLFEEYSYPIKTTKNDDGTNTYLVADTDKKTLFEETAKSYYSLQGNVIGNLNHGIRFDSGEKQTIYNAKLEKLGEFDAFKSIAYNRFYVGKSGDKYSIYSRTLRLVNGNAPAEVFDISYSKDIGDGKTCYIAEKEGSVSVFDESFALVNTKTLEEGQEFVINGDYVIYAYDPSTTSVKLAGTNFYVLNRADNTAKLVDSDGKTVRELPAGMNVTDSGYMFEEKDGVITFYDKDGKLIRKFNASYGSKTVSEEWDGTKSLRSLTDIIINDKDSATGKTTSYVYDLTTDTVKYEQTGKYDMVDSVYGDCVHVLDYPDSGTDGELWTDDSGYGEGVVLMDGTEIAAPALGQRTGFSDYCNGTYSRPDYRDFAIDTIYNDGELPSYYNNEAFYNPKGTAENVGTYIVINGVYIPIGDFAPDYSKANGYGAAVKLQYGTYVVLKDGKWGIAGADGKPLSEIKYDRICEFADGIAWMTVYEEQTLVSDGRVWNSSLGKYIEEGEEYTVKVAKNGIITKDGKVLVEPYYDLRRDSNHYNIEHFGNTYYTWRTVDADAKRYEFGIFKGENYFNEFTAKYGYDTAEAFGDLYLVSKDGLKGVVTADNEVVIPVEFAEILYVPANEKIAVQYVTEADRTVLSDPHYSSPISELGDGSKLVNVKTSEGRIRAYQIRDVEETTTTTTATTTTSTTTTTTTAATSTTTSTAATSATTSATTTTTSQPTTTITTTTEAATTATTASTTASEPATTADPRFVGTWRAYRGADREGSEVGETIKEGDKELYVRISLNSDFTGTIEVIAIDADGNEETTESGELRWTSSDDSVQLMRTDEDKVYYDMPLENGELYMSDFERSGYSFYFRKNDSAAALGDVDGDGSVSAKDASAILVEYSKLSTGDDPTFTEAQKAAADVNGDGKTDAKDASVILAYYAYLSTGGTDDMQTYLKK